jgi:hypothetical protein
MYCRTTYCTAVPKVSGSGRKMLDGPRPGPFTALVALHGGLVPERRKAAPAGYLPCSGQGGGMNGLLYLPTQTPAGRIGPEAALGGCAKR